MLFGIVDDFFIKKLIRNRNVSIGENVLHPINPYAISIFGRQHLLQQRPHHVIWHISQHLISEVSHLARKLRLRRK